MSPYKPGTVAVATVRGVPNVRVMKKADFWSVSTGQPAADSDLRDIRPLVVLDLGTAAVVAHLRKGAELSQTHPFVKSTITNIADQIEAQTKPPRIPEPGLWGVVEASWDSRAETGIPRAEWIRVKGNQWHSAISNVLARWDDLIDPALIREGVES